MFAVSSAATGQRAERDHQDHGADHGTPTAPPSRNAKEHQHSQDQTARRCPAAGFVFPLQHQRSGGGGRVYRDGRGASACAAAQSDC